MYFPERRDSYQGLTVVDLWAGLSYAPGANYLIFNGVRISPELIAAAFTQDGTRRRVIFEPTGDVRFLTSVKVGDTVEFTEHRTPSPTRWEPPVIPGIEVPIEGSIP